MPINSALEIPRVSTFLLSLWILFHKY